MTVGVYPGSFNPPTEAHLGIARAARRAHGLARIDLVISRRALNKEHVEVPVFEHRIDVVRALAERVGWLRVAVTDATLLVDIAAGYDLLILGADKWSQVLDPVYYGSEDARDDAVARLPPVAIAPRPPFDVPAGLGLDVPEHFSTVSSTAARQGAVDLMVPEARRFDTYTGAWTDPARYAAWLLALAHRKT